MLSTSISLFVRTLLFGEAYEGGELGTFSKKAEEVIHFRSQVCRAKLSSPKLEFDAVYDGRQPCKIGSGVV